MSRRVTLYIGGRKADLPDASPIQFTWTREELDNPTVVRNSYTQQLTLPGTPANDAIFGHFGRVDRATQALAGQTTGAYYNPLKKADFTLQADDMTVLARGYVKLDEITSRGDQATSYKISLYGGLGSLFYDLAHNTDGSDRTLADLTYKDVNDADVVPSTEGMSVDAQTLRGLWDAGLLDPVPDWRNILTYAPCYNGLPGGEFDANKAIVTQAAWYNFPSQTGYNPLAGAGASNPILATFANKHTEWEVRDFRAYLQRPAVSVKAIMEALTDARNTGDWTLALDGSFFTSGTNPWYDDAWMTLPMLATPEDGDWTALHLSDALAGGGMTPADFLIGYAKMFGLVFSVDESTQVVTLMARDDYYAVADTIDLSERVDIDTVSIKPCNASARWYEMKAQEVEAEYAKEYEETYGRVYGSQRIDTGWEFDSSVKQLLPSFPFRGAADVLEAGPAFYCNYYNSYQGLALVDVESVKYKLYDGSGNAQDFDAYVGQWLSKTVYWYNASYNGYDFAPKPQLHGADGKAGDGSRVLLIRTGDETLPSGMRWQTSDDTADMATLNDGRPCWLLDGNGYNLSKIPAFRRMAGAQTMDFGAPREIAVPGESTGEGASVYFNRWKTYLEDRLDVDTKVLTCKVDWRGFQVGGALLRNFYRWRNTIWSLNKISNYAPTVDGLTECEFVLVKDTAAYDNGQDVPAMASWYLSVYPGSLAFLPAGESKSVTVTANVAWTLTVPAWLTADKASGSGDDTVTLTAAQNTGANRSGTLAFSGAHSTSASVSVSQETSITPSLSVDYNNLTYDDKARTFYYHVTCNGRWNVRTITVGWIHCTSSGTGNGIATINVDANTGSSLRTGSIIFEMTDYPYVTYQTNLSQNPPAATLTYAVELGASSYTIPATGGNYTLAVQGVTYTNGVESSRVNLSASDLTITKSGSSAISRSGLTFSGANLGTTMTMEQTATFSVVWDANSSSATFTCKQAANGRTPYGDPTVTYSFDAIPNPIVWNSGSSTASKNGDTVNIVPTVGVSTTQSYVYDSGSTGTETHTSTAGGTVTVGGGGLSVSGTPSLYIVTWEANPNNTSRWGTVMVAYGGQSVTRNVTQAAGDSPSPSPSQITVEYEDGGITVTKTSVQRILYTNYTGWRFSGIQGMWYTSVTPSVGDGIYSDTSLTTQVGEITAVTY